MRWKLLARVFNKEHARHLSEVTKEEAEQGFLEGPLNADEVTERLGTAEWGIVSSLHSGSGLGGQASSD